MSILHHVFMLIFTALWTVIILYDAILMFNFVVVTIINMMLLCLCFVFIDTSLSKHVDMFFDFGFRLRPSEG